MTTPGDPLHQNVGSRLVMLDGLRGMAAIMVLMLHFDDLSGVSGLFSHGYLAVDFFYMLSGFVLVPLIEHSQAAVDPARLMARRLLRLWPLMALGVGIGLAVHGMVWKLEVELPLLAMALLYIPRVEGSLLTFPLNQPQWSLLVELAANLVHVLILRHIRTRGLLALSALCWLALMGASLQAGSLHLGSAGNDWLLGFVRAGFAYPLGIVLARHRARLLFPIMRWWLAPAMLVAALLVPAIPGLPDALMDPLAILIFPAVLAAGAATAVPGEVAHRLTWLGGISFPLYATHFPILEAAHVVGDSLPVHFRAPLLLGALGAAVLLAHLLARSPLANGFRLPLFAPKRLKPAA